MSRITPRRVTFAEIVEQTRLQSARAAWRRAAIAGNLRHMAVAEGNRGVARVCAAAKDRHILRAVELAGDRIRIVEATDDARFFSVRFYGERVTSLHIPKDRLAM